MDNSRALFYEIVQGFSRVSSFYIKHLHAHEQARLDSYYDDFVEEGKKQGLLTTETRLTQLAAQKLWLPADEKKIEELDFFIKRKLDTKDALFIPSQVKRIKQEIKNLENQRSDQLQKKYSLVGITVESYANKKVRDLYIYHSLYNAPDLKQLSFTKEEFEEEGDRLDRIYEKFINKFDLDNLKKIVISNFYQNLLQMASNLYEFYGIAVVNLTAYQSELYMLGNYFKGILSKNIPDIILKTGDPDSIESYYKGNAGIKSALEKHKSGTLSIAGLTPEDRELLGIKNEIGGEEQKLQELLKTQGKVNIQDYLKLMGEKV